MNTGSSDESGEAREARIDGLSRNVKRFINQSARPAFFFLILVLSGISIYFYAELKYVRPSSQMLDISLEYAWVTKGWPAEPAMVVEAVDLDSNTNAIVMHPIVPAGDVTVPYKLVFAIHPDPANCLVDSPFQHYRQLVPHDHHFNLATYFVAIQKAERVRCEFHGIDYKKDFTRRSFRFSSTLPIHPISIPPEGVLNEKKGAFTVAPLIFDARSFSSAEDFRLSGGEPPSGLDATSSRITYPNSETVLEVSWKDAAGEHQKDITLVLLGSLLGLLTTVIYEAAKKYV